MEKKELKSSRRAGMLVSRETAPSLHPSHPIPHGVWLQLCPCSIPSWSPMVKRELQCNVLSDFPPGAEH